MTEKELLDLTNNRRLIDFGTYSVAIGKKVDTPNTYGCFKGVDKWLLYETADDGTLTVFNNGTEEEIIRQMYKEFFVSYWYECPKE